MEFNLKFINSKVFKRAAYGVSAIIGVAMLTIGYLLYYPSFAFHVVVSISLVAVFAVPSIIITIDQRRKKQIDSMLPRFLEDVAESQESGMTLLKAFEESSKRGYGPITEELKKLVVQLTWGIEFEEAFFSFSSRINTDLTSKVTVLLVEAMTLGGDLKSTFQSVASFVREMIRLGDERESELRPYMMIIYVSSFVFMVIILILYQSFFLSMASNQSEEGFMNLPMPLEGYKIILYDLVVVVSFFGGITAGKLGGGKTVSGIKHSVILLLAASVVFGMFFLDPRPPIISDIQMKPLETAMKVTAKVKDPFPSSGVKSAFLEWTQDNWVTTRVVEMDYDMIEEYWKAQIPPRPVGTIILFRVKALDNSMNEAVDDNNSIFYSYMVEP